jgi:hypothetical protein
MSPLTVSGGTGIGLRAIRYGRDHKAGIAKAGTTSRSLKIA